MRCFHPEESGYAYLTTPSCLIASKHLDSHCGLLARHDHRRGRHASLPLILFPWFCLTKQQPASAGNVSVPHTAGSRKSTAVPASSRTSGPLLDLSSAGGREAPKSFNFQLLGDSLCGKKATWLNFNRSHSYARLRPLRMQKRHLEANGSWLPLRSAHLSPIYVNWTQLMTSKRRHSNERSKWPLRDLSLRDLDSPPCDTRMTLTFK